MSSQGVDELGLVIAQQIRRLRLSRRWSRVELAERCGVNVYTLKHFERFGQISLERLLKICNNLGVLEEVIRAFKPRQRIDIEEWALPRTTLRQRGRRRLVAVVD